VCRYGCAEERFDICIRVYICIYTSVHKLYICICICIIHIDIDIDIDIDIAGSVGVHICVYQSAMVLDRLYVRGWLVLADSAGPRTCVDLAMREYVGLCLYVGMDGSAIYE
jgi:hypothetical protein